MGADTISKSEQRALRDSRRIRALFQRQQYAADSAVLLSIFAGVFF